MLLGSKNNNCPGEMGSVNLTIPVEISLVRQDEAAELLNQACILLATYWNDPDVPVVAPNYGGLLITLLQDLRRQIVPPCGNGVRYI